MSERDGLYVTCPVCNRIQFKTEMTKSRMRCHQCNHDLYINVENGISCVCVIPDKQSNEATVDRVSRYVDEMFKKIRVPKKSVAAGK